MDINDYEKLYNMHKLFTPYSLIQDALALYYDTLTSLTDLAEINTVKAHLIHHLQSQLYKYIDKDTRFGFYEIKDALTTIIEIKDYTDYFKQIKILDTLLDKINGEQNEKHM